MTVVTAAAADVGLATCSNDIRIRNAADIAARMVRYIRLLA